MATSINDEITSSDTNKLTEIKKAYRSSVADAQTGVLNMKEYMQAMNDMAKELNKVFEHGEKFAEKALDTTERITKESQEIANSAKMFKAENQAREASYKKVIEDAKSSNEFGSMATAKKLEAKQKKEEQEAQKKFQKEQYDAMKDNFAGIAKGIFTFNPKELGESFKALKENLKETVDSYGGVGKAASVGLVKSIDKAAKAMSDFADGLKSQIKAIAGYKTYWDTRLYGSEKNHTSIADLVKNNIGISPYVKQENVMQKLNNAIEQGINYNVEQRAFLDVLSDNIATTFDAFDATLKDLVRVQQADSTAYRLGMEASLTEYLNRMFESTEYLTNLSDTVTANLYQASSLLDSTKAIGYEYQIQKWLGSMYSVGMSQSAIQSISDALGKALSGDISATDSGAGRLLVMAAANSGIDYAKLLTDGINESDVNLLLGSMVDYLQQIANDNKVVQSQMANIFGLQTADIEAATNLKGFLSDIYEMDKNYGAGQAGGKLYSMVETMGSRISMGQFLENLTDNFKYTLAEGIAANPALYSVLTIGDLLDQTVGGIKIPTISVFGNSVDLNATVADLLKMTSLAGSAMTGFGALMTGLNQIGEGFKGAFNNFIGTGTSKVSIGGGMGLTAKANDSSLLSMNYVGQGSSDSYMAANQAMIEDSRKEASNSQPVKEEEQGPSLKGQNQILAYLRTIVEEKESLNVNVVNMPKATDWKNEWLS